jgi:hypothetical protein
MNKKTLITIGLSVLLSAGLLGITGCAERLITPADPATGAPAQTNYAPNRYATQAAATIQAVAPFVPQPWGTIVSGVAVLITAAAGGIATFTQKRRGDEHASMLGSVIAGVETAGTADTKKAIQQIAAASGLGPKLDAIVQKVTGAMP